MRGAMFALVAVAVGASSASAIVFSGPAYLPPGGASCLLSGNAKLAGGATWTCTQTVANYSNLYIGIKNDNMPAATSPQGESMDNNQPSGAEIFAHFSTGASTIVYTGTTSVRNLVAGGFTTAFTRLTLTFTGSGSMVTDATTVALSNANGAVHSLWRSTAANFTVNALLEASDNAGGPWTAASTYYGTTLLHAKNTQNGESEISHVDVAFYYSTCGDSQTDTNFGAEQCDLGGANGASTNCCTSDCQFRGAEICRPGPGAPCDLSELCSGISSSCPPDDAPFNTGVVCRSGSGDSCDANETCTGTPGQGCPSDDAPGNAGVVCRVASVGDICDLDETCTGTPTVPCPPDDAPGKINMVCRAGSGDVCDPEERCTGIANQGCPPDVVANPATVCRTGSGDSCDPNETCTAIPSQPCPPDVVTPMGTQCRAAVGVCDVAEQCTGTALQPCPPNGFAAASTPCNTDNDLCTVDACNGSGACVFGSTLDCDDGNTCTQDSCDPIDGCESAGEPSMLCVAANKATLKVKKKTSNEASDNVKFIWKGGPALVTDMGDPLSTTRYELCIYDVRGPQMAMGVPPGTGWAAVGPTSEPTGFKYKDKSATNDGIRIIKLKGSNLGKARAKVTGKGLNLPDLADLPFQYPVTAQLYASDGMCWTAEFDQSQTRKNDLQNYKAKAP
jgi:hypothetical protein